jgi:pimeloyl-ACP methyl ester carboxylesterase
MSNFVLVHGAWSDSTAWNLVSERLCANGHHVLARDLPAHGADSTEPADATLDGYVGTVAELVLGVGEPVVLVGHSMAGTVISQVAERVPEAIERLVYVAAFMLPSGQSLYGFTQTSPGMTDSLLGPALRPGDGVLGVDPDQFVAAFCADAPSDEATRALSTLRPDPLAPLATPISITDERWGSVPRTYIHTTLDRCVSLASQREMVAATGAAIVAELDAGHLAMLSLPDELTARLTAGH